MVLPINRMKPGEKGTIVWLASGDRLKKRFYNMGVIPGENISCVVKAPGKGMRAYLVRNTVIGIRDENAGEIFVKL